MSDKKISDIIPSFNTHRNYLILIVACIVFFTWRECSNQKRFDNLVDEIANYSDSAKYFKGKNGELIAYNNTLKVQNEDQLRSIVSTNEQIREEIKKFKSVREVTTIKEKVFIHDTVELPANVIPCDFKPFTIRKDNKNYTFKGILSQKDFVIDSLYIPNDINIIVGKRKVGFLKYEDQFTVSNSNPYITTTNLKNISVKTEKKWFEKGWVLFTGGAIVGFGTSLGLSKAYGK